MKISSVVANNSIKLLSGLGNNEDSLTAMVAKDWISDATTVYTYKKEGGKDDAREKTIEEFGTGLVWLFGIPAVKKILEKTAYPLFKLNPKFDPRVLDDKNFDTIKQLAKGKEKELFDTLDEKNPVLKKFTNAQMYKGFGVAKFAIATTIAAFALTKIIKLKQKTTTDRIEKDKEKLAFSAKNLNSTGALVEKSVHENKTFESFTSNHNKNNISFTGGLAEVMYNPIKNTKILDAVIAGTRVKEGRKEELPEILLKEGCNYLVFYKLAEPVQKAFEAVGSKIKCPIKLDPKVLFSENLADKIKASKDSMETLKNSDSVIKTLADMDVKSPLIDLLANDGVIKLTKDKSSISFLEQIDEDAVKKSIKHLEEMEENIGNLKGSKIYKAAAVIGNVLLTVAAMGVIQPKLTILLRKMMYGSNENPAIAKQEQQALSTQA